MFCQRDADKFDTFILAQIVGFAEIWRCPPPKQNNANKLAMLPCADLDQFSGRQASAIVPVHAGIFCRLMRSPVYAQISLTHIHANQIARRNAGN